ncbi:hypothetical protein L210DRAFT_3488703 [Boletus edulis BED1]|uniref:DUF1295-domain-containing protein n=1 Tax=Boletus edulis BED1 TaxID=1328754 RepID=A0AAD4BGX2_BOLED|nr:hypothetical protein L210DRAFT_3488703 [Boletus edulis BED1]
MDVLNQQAPLFVWPIQLCLGAALTTYVLSLVTGNVSQVDRVWTFLPTLYTAYYALLPLWPRTPQMFLLPYTPETVHESFVDTFSPRALLMLALVVTWMFRLSYNTFRRGLFRLNEEDYRWQVLRENIPPWLFQVFNLTFVAVIQNIILMLLGVPAKIAVTQPHTSLGVSDYVLGALGFLTILIEFTADNQQYSYQTFKRSGKLNLSEWYGARIAWTKRDAERGFATKGLWAWSRHPNFFCEQSFWVIVNLIPLVCADGPWRQEWPTSFSSLAPLAPGLVLCTLFFSSTMFTESISLSKYPVAYKAYQQRVGMFIPLFTSVWGAILSAQGKREAVDEIVYGQEAKKVE